MLVWSDHTNKKSKTSVVIVIFGISIDIHPFIHLSVVIVILGISRPLLFDIDLSVAFEGADDDLVGAVGQMRKLYKINEGMFNIDM